MMKTPRRVRGVRCASPAKTRVLSLRAACVLLLTAIASLGLADWARARYVDCGHGAAVGAGSYNITAKRLPCSHARWVANRWSKRTLAGKTTRSIGRFRCRYRDAGYELVSVLCIRSGGKKAVRFLWGS